MITKLANKNILNFKKCIFNKNNIYGQTNLWSTNQFSLKYAKFNCSEIASSKSSNIVDRDVIWMGVNGLTPFRLAKKESSLHAMREFAPSPEFWLEAKIGHLLNLGEGLPPLEKAE